ncbi:MAG TPA: ABC transporter ATP-binding protein [Steroidobacteraceae bacterium]|nr:ABC transporter ATP-binding protein [Steroidobacteraceae bacterium]
MSAVVSPDMSTDEAIRCERITKHYGSRTVLRRVNLEVTRGTVLGLIGRNGAGKTTLIRTLLGLEQADEGRAFVFGEPSLSLSDATKQRIGYVPQQPDAFDWMRIGDMLEFVGRQYPQWDGEFVDLSLSRWQISADRRLASLSPGERQRVALIRALAVNPDLLVLDEPASALDPVARRDLLQEIVARAAESGTTIFFSTHIVSDLERIASRIVFLHDHRIVVDAALDDLSETHARLTMPSEPTGVAARPIPGEISRRRHSDGSVTLVIARAPGSDWPEAAAAPGVHLDALHLEDLFIEVAR